MLDEIGRLERVYSVYDESSELNEFRRSTQVSQSVSRELAQLFVLGLHWQQRTGGLFHPGLRAVTNRWRQAERDVWPARRRKSEQI